MERQGSFSHREERLGQKDSFLDHRNGSVSDRHGRLNAYMQRNRHTPIGGEKITNYHNGSRYSDKENDLYSRKRPDDVQRKSYAQQSSYSNNNNNGDNLLSNSIRDRTTKNTSYSETRRSFNNDSTLEEYYFKRANSFSKTPNSYSDCSNVSRSSDSSASTDCHQMFNQLDNSHSGSSSKSSTSFSKKSEERCSPLYVDEDLNYHSKIPHCKDNFKAFSSIVQHSQTPSPTTTTPRHISIPSSPTSTRKPVRHQSPSNSRTESDLRSLILSYSRNRQHSSLSNEIISNMSPFRTATNNPSYSRLSVKASSCSPNHTPISSLSRRRDLIAQKTSQLEEDATTHNFNQSSRNAENIYGYSLSKSSSINNVRHFSPPVGGSRNHIQNTGSNRPTSPSRFPMRNAFIPARERYKLGTPTQCTSAENAVREKVKENGVHDAVNCDRYIRPLDARNPRFSQSKNIGLSGHRPTWKMNSQISLNGPSSINDSDNSTGQYSRINPIKRNHSFCSDANKSRNRYLKNSQISGSQIDLMPDSFRESDVASNASGGSSFQFFGSIFNKNVDSSRKISKQRIKSPRTLENDNIYPFKKGETSSPASNYALPITQPTMSSTGEVMRPKNSTFSQTCTINLQDTYPQISPIATTLGKQSVTDSIKSQTSTLLSHMNNRNVTAGSSVTPPNIGFDLEALLKIDDLRSWIQELETSRAIGYQTLYSDYEDCDDNVQMNGE